MGSAASKSNPNTLEEQEMESEDFDVQSFSFHSSSTAAGDTDDSSDDASETEQEFEQEEDEEMMERLLVLEDARKLKQLAGAFLYPERPVVTTDARACGRNYFERPSGPQTELVEDVEELANVMSDLEALKKLAVDYLHPEVSVITTDACACGRSYYSRASAPIQESMEDMEEFRNMASDMEALKKLAVDYLHPEVIVATSDDCACSRNYFERSSAPQHESTEQAQECVMIMRDMKRLKKFAVDFAHPEAAIRSTDPFARARNYFGRFSAPAQLSSDEANDYDGCLNDSLLLKEYASHYLHPELAVVTTDAAAGGRNYFDRASAMGHDFISTTSHDSFQIIDDEDDCCYLEECDLHYGNFDMDEEMATDLKYQLHNLLEHCHDEFEKTAPAICDNSMDNEEDGKLSRSPSSVMLFGSGFEAMAS